LPKRIGVDRAPDDFTKFRVLCAFRGRQTLSVAEAAEVSGLPMSMVRPCFKRLLVKKLPFLKFADESFDPGADRLVNVCSVTGYAAQWVNYHLKEGTFDEL
jgi:hypothetical protein